MCVFYIQKIGIYALCVISERPLTLNKVVKYAHYKIQMRTICTVLFHCT